jgi:transcriptional regulator with GAF, ATPase, and Fis domain
MELIKSLQNRSGSTAMQLLTLPPSLYPVASNLLWQALHSESLDVFFRSALAALAETTGGDYLAFAAPLGGRWSVVAELGIAKPLPIDLIAESLDRDTVKLAPQWMAAPLADREGESLVLLVHWPASTVKPEGAAHVEHLAAALKAALASVHRRERDGRRVCQLETMLRIANQWNQTHEVEPLLVQMAEAAAHLLQADRASIFLWDKATHTLVGRPALGVKKGELRIPDDRGAVGQVVRDGLPRRINAVTEPDQIDHQVDSQLRYQTKTLLCVPLRHGGELIGAFEIINKQSGAFTREDEDVLVELASAAAVALENAQDRQQLLSTSRRIADQAAEAARLIGQSPAIEALRSTIRRVADTDLAVLIQGENGTGKEVVAQAIHYGSRRRGRPFIAVNCAAIPDTLAESELFGHEKGAFTDARETRQGKFELASGGTLFLDEIGDLSLGCQAKLLRVLEEKVLVRVGGSIPIATDTRVLTATNQNLAEMVGAKRFREDLYFRLNVVTLELPPLRQRGGDVLLLAEKFLADFCQKARRKTPQFSSAARKRLTEHPWPGNVRELRNLMERLAYLTSEDRIEAEDLAFILSPRGAAPTPADFRRPLPEATAQFQAEYIRKVIEQSGGNMSQAAEQLGLHRSNLYRKMKQLGMV